jgi:hypothetical protein
LLDLLAVAAVDLGLDEDLRLRDHLGRNADLVEFGFRLRQAVARAADA